MGISEYTIPGLTAAGLYFHAAFEGVYMTGFCPSLFSFELLLVVRLCQREKEHKANLFLILQPKGYERWHQSM